jgi:serine/threonine-protein kinase HipA
MRKGKVYYKEHFAGVITETDDGEFVFQYDENFVAEHPQEFITFTMPVTNKPYTDKRLFPFFDGLIPEGWLLDIASKNWKINKNDRMGLLLACCKNCIGAVSVEPIQEEGEK